VIGDFGGPSALERVGDETRARGHVVTVFYGSNVGVYLTRAQTRTFCRTLGRLPVAEGATFIERDGILTFDSKVKTCTPKP
jgi:hypothetical protein